MVKQMKNVAFLLFSLFILTGCVEEDVSSNIHQAFGVEKEQETAREMEKVGVIGIYDILQDSLTKCMYLRSKYGMSPYYDGAGKVAGCTIPGEGIEPVMAPEEIKSDEEESW